MKKCPKCGKEYPGIKRFCTICKELLIEEDTENQNRKEEQKRLKEKRHKYIAGIAAALLVAGFVIFVAPFQYNATQAYCENVTENYVEYYMGEEPYNDTEKYTETKLYNTTDYLSYKMISVGKGIPKCRSSGSGCHCTSDIGTIQNTDNISGKFSVDISFFSSEQQTHSTKIGSYLSRQYFLNPGESQRVEVYYTGKCDKTKPTYYPTYYRIDEVICSTKNVTKNQTITKYRNVTKYRN
ncbi:MAG: hypothetical protein COV98_00630, partial [Candidatus Altarchaeum sp. CG12_big_fil_rev_8_21_14_0_65_33_22]